VPAPADGGFRIDLEALEGAITPRTRAFFFATPNNPSGVILSQREMAVIGDLAEKHGLWLVADEVYAGLAPGGRVPGLAARLPDQVITVSSLSKSHSLPGWRAGWLVGPELFVRHAENLAMCNLFGLPGFIQDASVTALRMAESAERRIRDFCNARRDLLVASLADAPGICCCMPEAGMFALLDVRPLGMSGHEFSFGLFEAQGVAVLDAGAFGLGTRGFVRVCFATDEASLIDAAGRIRRYVHGLSRNTA
jgi:aspartate/methionine/tyrosine aminotransferase